MVDKLAEEKEEMTALYLVAKMENWMVVRMAVKWVLVLVATLADNSVS